jgi:metalloendopeptidase OMA1, mitochondrial
MESQEVYSTVFCDDDSLKSDNVFHEWSMLHDEAFMKLRRPLRIANKLKRWYQEAGFVDVHEEVFKLPINSWPRDPLWKLIGRCWCRQLLDGLSGMSLKIFSQAYGWSQAQTETYLVSVRQAIQNTSTHAYYKA